MKNKDSLKVTNLKINSKFATFELRMLQIVTCSVGDLELCLLNLLILIVFCGILTLVWFLRACHMWLTRNHMFICEIWGKFTSFIFWNFEISLVSLGRFQNLRKVNSVNLCQISLLNMWLLVQIPLKVH